MPFASVAFLTQVVAGAVQDCGYAGVCLFFDGVAAAHHVPPENQGFRRTFQARASGHAW